MNESYIKNVIEAALLAAGRPLQIVELTQLFAEGDAPEATAIRAALETLEADYTGRGIEVKETANGYRIQVRRDLANEISRLWPERPPKYSRALLETLALIAYRQPITRAEIEAVRGVAVNPNIIKTVLERNWVRVLGVRDVPGRPELLGTTRDFLDYFGLRGLEDLPPLSELKAMGDINLQLDLAKAGEGGRAALLAGGVAGAIGHDSDESGEAGAVGEAAAAVDGVEGEAAAVERASDEGNAGGDDNEAQGGAREVSASGASGQDVVADARSDASDDNADTDAAPMDDSDFDDAADSDEDSGDDDDELSAADSKTSGELVAASRDVDD